MITTAPGGGISVETLSLAKKFAKSYTDSAVSGISGGINYKGAVDYYTSLPSNPAKNDAYTVKYKGVSPSTEPDGTEYVWASYEGTLQWVPFGPDLSQYQKLLVSGSNIKTINQESLLGSGDVSLTRRIVVQDISSLTDEQCNDLRVGDIVCDDNYSFVVSYRTDTQIIMMNTARLPRNEYNLTLCEYYDNAWNVFAMEWSDIYELPYIVEGSDIVDVTDNVYTFSEDCGNIIIQAKNILRISAGFIDPANPDEYYYIPTIRGEDYTDFEYTCIHDNIIHKLHFYYDENDDALKLDLNNSGYEEIRLLTEDSSRMIETTYSDLVSLKSDSELIPGAFYRITDYVTKIVGFYDLTDIGAQGYLHFGKSAEHPYDIIVQAVDASTLSEVARAALHEGDTYFANANIDAWEIKYCLDNDTSRFSWADATNGKGVVYWMKDEWGNEAWYDFKNVLALRYALKLQDATAEYTPTDTGLRYNDDENEGDIQLNRYGDTYRIFTALQEYMQSGTYVNPFNFGGQTYGDYDFSVGYNILGVIQMAQIDATYLQAFNADLYYTFDYYDADNGVHIDASLNGNFQVPCQSNALDWCADIAAITLLNKGDQQGIGWNVFECNSECIGDLTDLFSMYANTMGNNCHNNTFGGMCFENKLEGNCYSNIFGNVCISNTFDLSCYCNTFGEECIFNTLGVGCYSNALGSYSKNNIFGDYCNDNVAGSLFWRNTFGAGCSYNTFGSGEGCTDNVLGTACSYNTFGDACINNVFGADCNSNEFGTYCTGNKFESACSHNTFDDRCSQNTFKDGCTYNTFGNTVIRATFGNSCDSNIFGVNCFNNVFGNSCAYNKIGSNCNSNKFFNRVQAITLGSIDNNNKLQGYIDGAIFENACGYIIVNEIGNSTYLNNLHVDGGTNTITIPSAQLSATGKYELHSYGISQEAVLVHKTGYNTETAVSTTDGGTTWT